MEHETDNKTPRQRGEFALLLFRLWGFLAFVFLLPAQTLAEIFDALAEFASDPADAAWAKDEEDDDQQNQDFG
jgi:hypothetical protein